MNHVLTPGMDPSLIETGVEGLTVTKVEAAVDSLRARLLVTFNRHPRTPGLNSEARWYYLSNGRHATGSCPQLTRKSQIDWARPIRAKTGTQKPLQVLCDMPDLNLVLVHAGNSTLPQLVRRDTGWHAGGVPDGDVENAPEVRTKRMQAFPGVVELTYTDGVLTGAEVVPSP